VFLKGLSRKANRAAESGKSKSNFCETADDGFIIKTLAQLKQETERKDESNGFMQFDIKAYSPGLSG